MGVRKTNNAITSHMIATAPVPTMIRLHRTHIDHTPWHIGTDKDMTMITTANHWINMFYILS